ncbi:methionine ABC transporter substrate-binding protein [Corynebacterium xerosis]|jgi:D-methionine transport system substrate-binding protein|uniref:Methionine ABC transporter substrate-binding protein n=1 Tax=Corynebacterium xerosis TaxID=1725 RepID=A0A2N6SZG2_9CORY|nr:MetQ/NlpA family ABC transporter substrate-binding protein [Corynebacterium xerosis]MDY0113031.1 MetQ/NlpA family ABC transporter substrate-binding protein [Corynebacterium sp.]NMF09565.1 methionine ABC transporter substrate-binding protein [Corynebacterium xerosis]PMC62467.1 methionine ABC transporter substrate-binding protein [Corynebacterium xerosis]QGS34858.1 methionine ABC transporter substrate-binding protein [Corynebacterium xerosis]HJG56857.1 MetQ/NlpA family ABC transporter substra
MALRRFAAGAVALAFAATGLVACGNDEPAAPLAEGDTIRIGTTDREKEAWSVFEKKAADAGIDLEVVEFSEYPPVNTALSEGELDVNLFQHLKYLAQYNVGSDQDLTPIGSTEIVPLALFWTGGDKVEDIEDGTEVVIPNDSTNQGRALSVLEKAGLIALKGDSANPSPLDIDTEKSRVSVTPIDAAQTTAAYGEGTPAVINNSFLERAGIDPNTAIFQDDPEDAAAEPYINVFATTQANKDNADLKKLAELWHDPEVLAAVDRDSRGTSVPVNRPAAELEEILERAEKDARENPDAE